MVVVADPVAAAVMTVARWVGAAFDRMCAYPAGYRHHGGCHWVSDYYHGRTRSYEVCRGRDGEWRPYGD